jgi:adenylate kinase family enzyme
LGPPGAGKGTQVWLDLWSKFDMYNINFSSSV